MHGKLGYIEIIKKGVHVANRNLAVLLTQFVAGVALFILFFLLVAAAVLVAVGSIPKLGLQDISPDTFSRLIETSFSLVSSLVAFGVLFIVAAVLITAYVHSGNLGCLIETATGSRSGFAASTFFSTARRFMFSMLGLYIICGVIGITALLAFLGVGGVGIGAVLMPLKDAGHIMTAFAIGVPFIAVLMLGALLVVFFLYAGWAFSGIIMVGERRTALSSLSGAYHFIGKNFWDTLLFSLLVFVLVFAANVFINIVTMPLGMMSETRPAVSIALAPLLLVGVLLQMYFGLIARASFVAYYVIHRQSPEAVQPAQAEPQIEPPIQPPPVNP